jgi:hypothetical protein
MIYGGSQVTKGRAKAVITATAMNTELGKIAQAMERQVKSKETGWRAKWHRVKVALGVAGTSPLQIKLNKIAYLLLSIAILLAIIVLASTAFTDIPDSISTVSFGFLGGFLRLVGRTRLTSLSSPSQHSTRSPRPSPSSLHPSSLSSHSLWPPPAENSQSETRSSGEWMREFLWDLALPWRPVR